MSLLHDYFNTRNLQALQRLLDGQTERGASSAPASSGAPASISGSGKSWSRTGGVLNGGSGSLLKVNARDWLGRTVLHLACNAVENIEYVRALLKHPNIDVNLPDTESMWTPLHRALYAANFPVALLLLQFPGIDTSLKDLEGYTAFDLYNSTLNGTKPNVEQTEAELYTWGANRNAALGVGDENDRTYPEQIVIQFKDDPETVAKRCLSTRLSPIHVQQVHMSRLHTAVVTNEREGNLRLCGFGSGGRLGLVQHTQYSLSPMPSFNLEVASVVLGQDHTLVLTRQGEVYSWGLNRFSQLGFIVETSTTANGRLEEPIQTVPKRVVGPLRREVVRGVAASKNASACWTADTVFTWGTNTGQLGYDKNAQPVQITPRPITKFTNIVIDLAMNDTVLTALLVTRHVECIWNDRHYRISFPMHAFPTGIEPYRPPQSIRDSLISKVTCCDDTFAALSLNGEVFTFSPPKSTGDASSDGRGFVPQRVWALRKKFSAVKDVALGSGGSIIVCTESGHVFVRTRNTKNASAKAFKFDKIPFLQRVTRVCANSTGAFGALKVDYRPNLIEISGNTVAQDLKNTQPYFEFYKDDEHMYEQPPKPLLPLLNVDEDPEDGDVENDVNGALALCRVLENERRMRKNNRGSIDYMSVRLPYDADTMIQLSSGEVIPVHRVILAARSRILADVLSGRGPIQDRESKVNIQLLSARPGPTSGVRKITRLAISGIRPFSLLILLYYLYSDELLAIWDHRIGMAVSPHMASLGVDAAQIKRDLQVLALLLELPPMAQALEAPVKRNLSATMARDMGALFAAAQTAKGVMLLPDVILQLKDQDVSTYSVVLRARSALFASFFDLEDWSAKRWSVDGVVQINLRHMTAHVMQFVLKFMCCGADQEMFYQLDFIQSTEELIPFMFEVLAAANELHLDRLILICSSVILQYTTLSNACYVLADASHYRIPPLIEALQEYMTATLEVLLSTRMLDTLPYSLVKQLSKYVQSRQVEKAPFTRGSAHITELVNRHADWLALQDLPEPTMRHSTGEWRKEGTPSRVVPVSGGKLGKFEAPISSTPTHALRRPPSGDDIFLMDDADSPAINSKPAADTASPPVWKAHGAPKVDMKAVMAEAASQRAATQRVGTHSARPRPQPLPGNTPPKSGTSPAWRTSAPVTPPAAPISGNDGAGAGPSRMQSAFGASAQPPATPTKTRPGATDSPRQQPAKGMLSGTRPPTTTASAPPSPANTGPALGPVITPTKLTPTKSGGYGRNVIGGKAWTQPPPPPSLTRAATAPDEPTRGMSFIAIQHLQQEQGAPVRDKRSLREIQEEEHALQEEAEFLKWWTAEEERVQREALALAQFERELNNPQQRHSKSKKKKNDASAPAGSGEHQRRRPPRAGPSSTSGGSGGRAGEHKPQRPRETSA